MVSLIRRDDGGVGRWPEGSESKEIDGTKYQIGLELAQVDVEDSVEPQRGCDGRDGPADKPVEVGIAWPLDVQLPPTNVIDRLIVHHECAIAMLQGGGRAQG